MAKDILMSAKTPHLLRHDLESIYYVLLFCAVMYFGPDDNQRTTQIPWFIGEWVLSHSEDQLAVMKHSLLSMEDEIFEEKFLDHVTPYFQCMKPLLRELRVAIQAKTINHDMVIKSLRKLIKSLEPEVLKPMKCRAVKPSPIERIKRSPDFKHMKELNERFKERLGPALATLSVMGQPISTAPGSLESSKITSLLSQFTEQTLNDIESSKANGVPEAPMTRARHRALDLMRKDDEDELTNIFGRLKLSGSSRDDNNIFSI